MINFLMKSTIYFLILIVSVVFFSCANDENETNQINQNGGIISRYQCVTIDVGTIQLSNETYIGTLNNQPIELSKVDENKLVFYVDETTTLGKSQLIISELNNAKINYEVIDVILTQTSEATLQPLIDFQEQYGSALTTSTEDAPFLQNHNAITTYYANLSDVEKIEAAKFYKANKAIIDAVYNTNYDAIQGRNLQQTQTDFDFALYRALVFKHSLAIVTTIIAGKVAVTPPYEPTKTIIASSIALAGIYKSRQFHGQVIEDVYKVVGIKLDNVLGFNNRNVSSTNAPLSLTNNETITIPFEVNARNLNNADSNTQKEFVSTFFNARNRLNIFISKINSTIVWINNNVPLLNLVTTESVNIPNTTTVNSFEANSQIMQRFSFSVNHPNLQLENATLSNTGLLNLKIKFIGNPSLTTINSSLNYTYSDDFSSFSGSFPIVVTAASACGNSTDIDGNVYESVTIGTQCWMKSNLNVSRYRNGDVIPQVTDPAAWNQLTTGAWCYYENNTANGTVYGKIYNWYAVNDPRGLAPEGYHIPSDAEWTVLINFLGGENLAGGKMKTTTGWNAPNTGATNNSNFTGLPGGYRPNHGGYINIGAEGYWWSASSSIANEAWCRSLTYDIEGVWRFDIDKVTGFSVRCIKN